MALVHYVLTLDGTAQRLSSALPDTTPSGRDDVPIRTISLQPAGANGNPIYVGGTNVTVSATDYGWRLEAGVGGVPPAPFILGEHDQGPMKLSNFFVIGTAGQVLHIAIVPF